MNTAYLEWNNMFSPVDNHNSIMSDDGKHEWLNNNKWMLTHEINGVDFKDFCSFLGKKELTELVESHSLGEEEVGGGREGIEGKRKIETKQEGMPHKAAACCCTSFPPAAVRGTVVETTQWDGCSRTDASSRRNIFITCTLQQQQQYYHNR